MKIKKYKNVVAPFLACLVFTLFIFSNSLKGASQTNSDSGYVMSLIKPFIDRIFNIGQDELHWLVRKSAHFIEFCLLGISTSCLVIEYNKIKSKLFIGWGLFYCLSVANIDEFIQSFTGRTSSISDVLLDFLGAMFGVLIVFTINAIIKKRK